MKTSIHRITILLFLCLLFGCQARVPQTAEAPQEHLTNTAIATLTQTVAGSLPPSITPVPPTPSPSPIPSSTPEPSVVQKDCFPLLPDFPPNAKPQGVLILEYQSKNTFVDWETGNSTETGPQTRYSQLQVSPDRKKVAYQDTQSNQIVVMTEDNKILRRIRWNRNWINLARWQNNEMLLVETSELLKSDAPNPPNVLAMLDISTGQSRKMIPDYPDISQGYTLPWLSGHTVYDPALTRVVYTQTLVFNDDYVLWDVPGKRELIALKADTREEPVWAPDGSTFIVFTANGLSLVSRDGVILYTNDLRKYLYDGSDDAYTSVRNYSYSPDGKRVAFWLEGTSTGEAGNYTLMILDIGSGKIIDTCLNQGDFLPNMGYSRTRLVWSPRGDQLAAYVNVIKHASGYTWDAIIADVGQKYAVKVAENRYPTGWMVKAPK